MPWQPQFDHGDTLGGPGVSLKALVFFLCFSSHVENADVYGLSRGSSGLLPGSVPLLSLIDLCGSAVGDCRAFVASFSVPFQNPKSDLPATAERSPRTAALCQQ